MPKCPAGSRALSAAYGCSLNNLQWQLIIRSCQVEKKIAWRFGQEHRKKIGDFVFQMKLKNTFIFVHSQPTSPPFVMLFAPFFMHANEKHIRDPSYASICHACSLQIWNRLNQVWSGLWDQRTRQFWFYRKRFLPAWSQVPLIVVAMVLTGSIPAFSHFAGLPAKMHDAHGLLVRSQAGWYIIIYISRNLNFICIWHTFE